MPVKTQGIHHISAIVGDVQENVDFYVGVLGLRLIKKTVNFDDPGTYHLYFGNGSGQPGTLITFFPWQGAYKGRVGDGQVGVISFAVPRGALRFWEERLQSFQIPYQLTIRFHEPVLVFRDSHGVKLELVERIEGEKNTWSFGGIRPAVAITGFAGATLYSKAPEKTSRTLTEVFGLEELARENDCVRFQPGGAGKQTIDVQLKRIGHGRAGAGMVHHIAFRAIDDEEHAQYRRLIAELGYAVTPVRDRYYFKAIYFKDAGDILFEVATDGPGFTRDETHEDLGETIKLPPQYANEKEKYIRSLKPIIARTLPQKQ